MASHPPSSPRADVPAPPGTWAPARRAAEAVRGSVERFLSIEASSGILLLVVAAVALVWANSRWAPAYEALWHTPIGLRLGPLSFERSLHFWINDGLMTIFFFVVGLEIRREIHCGELSDGKRAALPLAAAVGGMLAPAGIYAAFNAGHAGASGWGVPMATDIAFAVGVLALLGNRVAPALRILLLALAVIDDVGAILVIALFYSSGISLIGIGIAAMGIVIVLVMQAVGVRAPLLYVAPGIVVWAGAYASGAHPTLAGVIVGMLTPVRAWLGRDRLAAQATEAARAAGEAEGDDGLLPHLDALSFVNREAVSPVERLQHALHGWVAYLIMPVFALANAGVPLGAASLDGDGLRVFAGVSLGLLVGKPIGVVLVSWLVTRAGVAALPRGVVWSAASVVGLVAGIGFTMALFVAGLAFPPGPLLETAKLGILCGSGAAAIVGYAVGRRVLRAGLAEGAARSETEAESSTAA